VPCGDNSRSLDWNTSPKVGSPVAGLWLMPMHHAMH